MNRFQKLRGSAMSIATDSLRPYSKLRRSGMFASVRGEPRFASRMHCDYEPGLCTRAAVGLPLLQWRRGLGRGGRWNLVNPPRGLLVGVGVFLGFGAWDLGFLWSLGFGASPRLGSWGIHSLCHITA